ncbi:hypothetical protein EIP86_008420 [Pleurotus ostreatoroseus]|nr:hypothetical protein EIP86_008420 [Pleurotus ostreatoroseus]
MSTRNSPRKRGRDEPDTAHESKKPRATSVVSAGSNTASSTKDDLGGVENIAVAAETSPNQENQAATATDAAQPVVGGAAGATTGGQPAVIAADPAHTVEAVEAEVAQPNQDVIVSTMHPLLADEDDLCVRLNRLNDHFNERTSCATLHNVPFDRLRWGPVGYGRQDKSTYLMLGDHELMLWAVAEIVGLNLYAKVNGVRTHPARRQSIMFKPLLASDYDMACRIVKDMAHPIKELEPADGLWAGRFMGAYGAAEADTKLMDRVYDARSTYCGKDTMNPYPTEKLRRGDIVLLEMNVGRWAGTTDAAKAGPSTSAKSAKTPAKAKKYEPKVWTEWVVDLRLDALSVLAASPVDNGPINMDENIEI